ncbi:neprosin family prolyl endopeptidase [Actinoplanes palleronii]|uniref:Neprosin PEP catalytic domain-containing protein n=1 Tax=Actinoplanes palleronii TaxID=113570 RepID=A0ABQ4BC27_9ACTN|nr:neprosin family prolyl endopeptidase [Actinoplanes palleronii]GIE67795.1 hypothetical protein Apa02nite_039030 [Actinoplanes palleronii]
MLKSRRGLLAAGLSVAVIGAIGVASTLNAGAEQIPDGPAAATAPAEVAEAPAAADPALKPPTILPWGEEPQLVKRGQDGATSRALKAAGLSAAAPGETDVSDADEYAPKGRSSKSRSLQTTRTTVVPPKPLQLDPPPTATASPSSSGSTVHFLYNVGWQAAVSDGAYANLTINKPVLAQADYHTLAELAVQSADGTQIVEVGWNVDRVVNGDDDPHLFVYHWVNGQTSCYNGCGYVQYSNTITPGDTLSVDIQKKFGIQFYGGAWWIAYDTEWVGYFPANLWTVDFAKTGMVQIFGEVAASSAQPCTQMGNGLAGLETTAARIGSVAYINGPTPDVAVRSTSSLYQVSRQSTRTFRYGGAGAC